MKKAEGTYERQVRELKNYYEGVISELQDKMEMSEKNYSSRLEDILENDKVKSQSLGDLSYAEKFIETVKREFQLFYDKYISSHSKSFDSKQGHRR